MRRTIVSLAAFVFIAIFAAPANAIIDCHSHLGCREIGPVVKTKIVKKGKIANRRTVEIRRGLAGEALSPMLDLKVALERKGYRVIMTSFYSPPTDAEAIVAHSMGCFHALASKKKKIITVDCPIWAHAALPSAPTNSSTMNVYTPGHPRVYGAVNVRIGIGHITAPQRARKYILAVL